MLYKNGRSARLATLEKHRPATAASKPATATRAATVPARLLSTAPAAAVAAGSTPGVTPSVVLAGGVEVSLQPSDNPLEYWRGPLAEAGVTPADIDLILAILAQNLDSKRLTAIYRMDPAELDKVLPLEIVPAPKRLSRIALVVVTGIDPALGEELDTWIKQLADPSWPKREQAMKEIQQLGMKAQPALQKALKDKDIEVVHRAEQLLEILNPDAPPQPQN
jgi:hypothetical protein